MIKVYSNTNECCGCGACAQACDHNAITMQIDSNGFKYPVIDQNKCIDCNLCINTCNFKPQIDNTPVQTYVAQRKSSEIKKSASGGIFAELAHKVIEKGGVVFGCILKKERGSLFPIISEATDKEEVEPMLGSKYVQSDTADTYKHVKDRLKIGRLVLYSGLPCQIAGLKAYLRKDYDNLITLDIICHGTPNEKYFQAYIADLEKKIKGSISSFNFRGKVKVWGEFTYTYSYTDCNGKEKIGWGRVDDSVYYKLFLASSIYRESCYYCPFASTNRPSDITIGDCWGVDKEYPSWDKSKGGVFDFKKGTSCVIVNTSKGFSFLKENNDGFEIENIQLEKITKYNHQLYKPSVDSPYRKNYYEAFNIGGYKALKRKYYQMEWKQILKLKIYLALPKGLLKFIKSSKQHSF